MRTETPNSYDSDKSAMIQLGQRALAQLKLEAKAAQIEARQAELELLMEQAHHGNFAPLHEWLRVNGQQAGSSGKKVAAPALIDDWPSLIPFARIRLAQICESASPSSPSVSRPISIDETCDPSQSSCLPTDIRADRPHTQSPIENSDQADSLSLSAQELDQSIQPERSIRQSSIQLEDTKVTEQKDSKQELELPLEQIVAELGLDATEAIAPTNKGRWRGVIVSTIFHVVLLVVLGLMTFRNPVKNGLLALVAGGAQDSTELESFELINDSAIEPSESTEMTEPTPQTNLAEVLPGLNASVSQSLTESLATTVPTASRTNVMAAKAGPSKSVMSFYGAESTGNSFCFVLDGSGSMRGGPWEAARQELLKSIGALKPSQRFYIIFFNKDVFSITQPGSSKEATSPLTATPENLAHAKRWLDTLQITTGEPPMKALEAALAIESDCIYFLADGEMSDSVSKRLLDMLQKKNRSMDILDGEVVTIPIHTIAYYSDKGLDIMRRIAAENRGQFSYVPKPKTARSGK